MIGPFIFLDIDGVLNGHDRHANGYCGLNRDCVEIFNSVLKASQAKVIVTSAWRYFVLRGEMTVQGIQGLLCTHGVSWGHVVDVLPADIDTGTGSSCRGTAVKQWFAQRWGLAHSAKYVCLDDLDLGYTAHGLNFIQTPADAGLVGLSRADVDRLYESLGA